MKSLHLPNVSIQNSLILRDVVVSPGVFDASFHVGKNALFDRARFTTISLHGSKIDADLHIVDVKALILDLSSVTVTGDTFIAGAIGTIRQRKFNGQGDVVFGGGAFQSVDLAGSTIQGTMTFGSVRSVYRDRSEPIVWRDPSELDVSNATAWNIGNDMRCAMPSCPDPWSKHIALTGLSYKSLDPALASRSFEWWRGWLSKSDAVSMQPYDQLATVLTQSGRGELAEKIQILGYDKKRNASPFLQRAWFYLYDAVTGYGHHSERAMLWTLGFIMMGVVVLKISGEGRRFSMPYGFAFSFDRLIPVVTLRKNNEDVQLQGWAKYYFYLHRIIGFILASVIVAAIAGLQSK